MARSAASRLTAKYQATIPAPVRKVLGLKSGDGVLFEIRGERVTLRKQTRLDLDHATALAGTLESEWLSDADESAYREL